MNLKPAVAIPTAVSLKKVEYLAPLVNPLAESESPSLRTAPGFTTLQLAGYLTITDKTGEAIYLQAIGPRIWTPEHTLIFQAVRDTLLLSLENKLEKPVDIEPEPDLYS